MPFYTGKSADGSDMREAKGMHVSPDGKSWSNTPFTKEQYEADREEKRQRRIYQEIYDYCNARMTFRDAYNEIKNKKSGLSARCKKYLIDFIENKL